MRREVIALLQIHHPNIVPFLGVASDSHHPLALVSPFYSSGHVLLYLKKLENTLRPVMLLNIVRLVIMTCAQASPLLSCFQIECLDRICTSVSS